MKRSAWFITMLAASAVAGQGGIGDQGSRDAERRIARWNAAEEDQYVPPACIRSADFTLEGEWAAGNQWASSSLRFTPKGDGRFDVTFSARWYFVDFGEGWTLKRTAKLSRGAVSLNRAVADLGGTYSRLWPLEVGPYKQVALVPTAVLDDVRRAYKAGGCTHFSAAFECDTCFGRRPSKMGPR